jgi:hypothetical protein
MTTNLHGSRTNRLEVFKEGWRPEGKRICPYQKLTFRHRMSYIVRVEDPVHLSHNQLHGSENLLRS